MNGSSHGGFLQFTCHEDFYSLEHGGRIPRTRNWRT